jgi:catechol 2,3-dioxygenase-like lactoylglutathione lyase family enzyme
MGRHPEPFAYNMTQKIGAISLVVRDYDEAISFYTKKLRFDLIEDTDLGDGKRWVLLAPRGSGGSCLLLAKASSPFQENFIGSQSGGRVFLFLHTDDFLHDYQEMESCGIIFKEDPRVESYGMVVVFEDLYGNKWDLLELNNVNST